MKLNFVKKSKLKSKCLKFCISCLKFLKYIDHKYFKIYRSQVYYVFLIFCVPRMGD